MRELRPREGTLRGSEWKSRDPIRVPWPHLCPDTLLPHPPAPTPQLPSSLGVRDEAGPGDQSSTPGLRKHWADSSPSLTSLATTDLLPHFCGDAHFPNQDIPASWGSPQRQHVDVTSCPTSFREFLGGRGWGAGAGDPAHSFPAAHSSFPPSRRTTQCLVPTLWPSAPGRGQPLAPGHWDNGSDVILWPLTVLSCTGL